MEADVVVVTVIPVELRAVLAALGMSNADRMSDSSGTRYYHGARSSALTGRPLRVAVTCIGRAGNPHAAVAVRDAIAAYRPRAVILAGIAAGIEGRVQIGQVVLSERVVSYEPAALVAGSGVEPRPEIVSVPHAMSQHIVNYGPDPRRIRSELARVRRLVLQSSSGGGEAAATDVDVLVGTIASGEKLFRDAASMDELRALHGKTAAVDMESAGVVAACSRDNVQWLVIRGISDYGDARKDDRHHELASSAAAVVLADFLVRGLDLPPFDVLGARVGLSGLSPQNHPMQAPLHEDERGPTPGEPPVDILLWASDDRGVTETVWLTEQGDEARIVARTPRFILAGGDSVWIGRRTKRAIELLDPRDHGRYWERLGREDDPAAELRRVPAEVDDLVLIGADSGEAISLSAPTVIRSDGAAFELEQSISLLCTVGPYLFARAYVHAFWGGAHPFGESSFRMIDLRSGNDVDLLRAPDRERLVSEEGQQAVSLLRRAGGGDWVNDSPPEVTLFTLSYSRELQLSAEYQFTVGATYIGSDRRWSSYSRSESVYSERLPTLLEEFREAPRVLQRYWSRVPRFSPRSTWTSVRCTLEMRALLNRLFEGDGAR